MPVELGWSRLRTEGSSPEQEWPGRQPGPLARPSWNPANQLWGHEPGAKSAAHREATPGDPADLYWTASVVNGAKSAARREATPGGPADCTGRASRSPTGRQLEGALAYQGKCGSVSNRR